MSTQENHWSHKISRQEICSVILFRLRRWYRNIKQDVIDTDTVKSLRFKNVSDEIWPVCRRSLLVISYWSYHKWNLSMGQILQHFGIFCPFLTKDVICTDENASRTRTTHFLEHIFCERWKTGLLIIHDHWRHDMEIFERSDISLFPWSDHDPIRTLRCVVTCCHVNWPKYYTTDSDHISTIIGQGWSSVQRKKSTYTRSTHLDETNS